MTFETYVGEFSAVPLTSPTKGDTLLEIDGISFRLNRTDSRQLLRYLTGSLDETGMAYQDRSYPDQILVAFFKKGQFLHLAMGYDEPDSLPTCRKTRIALLRPEGIDQLILVLKESTDV